MLLFMFNKMINCLHLQNKIGTSVSFVDCFIMNQKRITTFLISSGYGAQLWKEFPNIKWTLGMNNFFSSDIS